MPKLRRYLGKTHLSTKSRYQSYLINAPLPFYFCNVQVIVCTWSLCLFFSVIIMAGIFPVSVIIFNEKLMSSYRWPWFSKSFPSCSSGWKSLSAQGHGGFCLLLRLELGTLFGAHLLQKIYMTHPDASVRPTQVEWAPTAEGAGACGKFQKLELHCRTE